MLGFEQAAHGVLVIIPGAVIVDKVQQPPEEQVFQFLIGKAPDPLAHGQQQLLVGQGVSVGQLGQQVFFGFQPLTQHLGQIPRQPLLDQRHSQVKFPRALEIPDVFGQRANQGLQIEVMHTRVPPFYKYPDGIIFPVPMQETNGNVFTKV